MINSTKSGMHFDLHPRVEVIIMAMDLPVLAVQALTLLRALFSCPVALTIIFAAL
jgi:hypothetical protein